MIYFLPISRLFLQLFFHPALGSLSWPKHFPPLPPESLAPDHHLRINVPLTFLSSFITYNAVCCLSVPVLRCSSLLCVYILWSVSFFMFCGVFCCFVFLLLCSTSRHPTSLTPLILPHICVATAGESCSHPVSPLTLWKHPLTSISFVCVCSFCGVTPEDMDSPRRTSSGLSLLLFLLLLLLHRPSLLIFHPHFCLCCWYVLFDSPWLAECDSAHPRGLTTQFQDGTHVWSLFNSLSALYWRPDEVSSCWNCDLNIIATLREQWEIIQWYSLAQVLKIDTCAGHSDWSDGISVQPSSLLNLLFRAGLQCFLSQTRKMMGVQWPTQCWQAGHKTLWSVKAKPQLTLVLALYCQTSSEHLHKCKPYGRF